MTVVRKKFSEKKARCVKNSPKVLETYSIAIQFSTKVSPIKALRNLIEIEVYTNLRDKREK